MCRPKMSNPPIWALLRGQAGIVGRRFVISGTVVKLENELITVAQLSRHQARHDLAAVAAVDFEIGIGGQHHGVGQGFAHAHEAGIGQAHGHIGVFGAQVEHLEQLVREVQTQPQMSLAQKFFEGARVRFVQKKERLGHNGLAG